MVDYQDLLQRLKDLKDGAAADAVEMPAALLASTVDGIEELQEDLQNAKDMLMMKPSMAKKLNEKIRLLEEQLEQLRAKNKVKEMEKKIQNLQAELKASYATKNFTLKNNLLELEKKYQDQLQSNDVLAEMWSDVAAILNEDAKEVMPSYMSRSTTFLRVGTMARPGAPLTHGQGHTLDHVPEAEADVAAAAPEESTTEPVSAVQAVKQRLEVKIEQASREAALAGTTNMNVPTPGGPTASQPSEHKRAPSASSDGKSAEMEIATTPNMSVDAAREHFRGATAPVNNADPSVATNSFLRPAAPPSDTEASTAEQEDHVRESLSMLRTIYSNLAQEVVSNARADGSIFTRQVQTVQTHVAQLRQAFTSSGVDGEADQFLDAVEELRVAYQTANTPVTELEQKMDVVLMKVDQLRKSLPTENGVLVPERKTPIVPPLHTLRQDSIQDIDLLTDAPSLAQADVNTLVTLFSTFAQELAEQRLLPHMNQTADSDATATPPNSLPSDASNANELVQYFRLYMTTQGGAVLRKLLKDQGPSTGYDSAPPTARGSPSKEPTTQTPTKGEEVVVKSTSPPTMGEQEVSDKSASAPTKAEEVGVTSTPPPTEAEEDAVKSTPARADPTPSDVPGPRTDSSTPLPTTSSLPPLSPATTALVLATTTSDGATSTPTPTPTDAPSSMGKKTFSAVARAVYMLNTKYKNILPDTPQTDALFTDLANMLENVIATHELKSHASKQIIARSLKQRSSGPPSVASLGNWDSVGTPTGQTPESPFRSGLRGPGSDGQHTPVASRTPRGDLSGPFDSTDKQGAQEAAVTSPLQVTPEVAQPAAVEGAATEAVAAAASAQDGAAGTEPTLELLSPPMTDKRVKELQNENEYLTRILIDAKVELADTKGEYMALLRALRKALSRENNARSKLDELERVVSVMAPGGPGVSALQEEMVLRPIRTRQTDDGSSEQTGSARVSRTPSQQDGEIQPA